MYKNTETTEIYNKRLCVYCGEEANHDEGNFTNHGHEWDDFYFCECDGAKLEIEKQEKIKEVKILYENKLRDYKSHGEKMIEKYCYTEKREKLLHELKVLDYKYNKFK